MLFDELAEDVYRRRYASLDLNVGVVVSEDGLLVVDTRASHVEADELRSDLRTLTRLPVRWVIDTHWHWDHTFGNARFPEAEIWGHEQCRRALLERGESMKADAAAWLPEQEAEFEAVVITPPTRVFTEVASVELGSRLVTLSYHGLAHTDADVVVSLDGLSFMGDLLENGAPPVFDDGYPISWPRTLTSALAGEPSTLVPGHGDVMDLEAARAQLGEIQAVADLAGRCLDEGLPVTEAVALGPYPEDVMAAALSRAVAVGL